jgi:hypothetical protein
MAVGINPFQSDVDASRGDFPGIKGDIFIGDVRFVAGDTSDFW